MGRVQERTYAYNGQAGLVKQVHSRATGHLVSIYHAVQAEITSTDPWVTVCETHGTMASHRSLRLAEKQLPTGAWCEHCMQAPRPAAAMVLPRRVDGAPHGRGRRPRRLVSVTGGLRIWLAASLYTAMGCPAWIAVARKGRSIVLRPATEPEKQGDGVYKVTHGGDTGGGGGINPGAFLAANQVADGRYKPSIKDTTITFTPTQRPAPGSTGR